MRTYIYVIGRGEEPIKIGIANNTARRLCELQIGCPDELTLHYAMDVPAFAAQHLEKALHQAYEKWHRRGEWFDVKAATAIKMMERDAPAFIEGLATKLRRSPHLFDRLEAEHDLAPNIEEKIIAYRHAQNDPRRRADLERMNRLIFDKTGAAGLQVFRMVIVEQTPLERSLNRQPGVLRLAEAKLVAALNALAKYPGKQSVKPPLDGNLENAA